MQKHFTKIFGIICFILGLITLTSCSNATSPNIKLSFEEQNIQIKINETYQLNPIIDTEVELQWKSLNNNVVTVKDGLLEGVGVGKTSIRVNVKNHPSVHAKINVDVIPDDVNPSVLFNQIPKVMSEFDEFQIETIAQDNFQINYSSLNRNVLSVSEDGLITALSNGLGIINVKVQNQNTLEFSLYQFEILVKPVYKIIYNLDNGTNHKDNITYYNEGDEPFTLLEPVKEGYAFKGWYSDDKFENKITEIDTTILNNQYVYAKWIELKTLFPAALDTTHSYKLALNQENIKKTIFIDGKLSRYYATTTQDFNQAADLNIISVTDGYNLKLTLAEQEVVYIDLEKSGNYVNIKFNTTPKTTWQYNAVYNTFTTNINNADYFIGTPSKNKYETLGAYKLSNISDNFVAHLYRLIEYTDQLKANDVIDSIKVDAILEQDYDLPIVDHVSWQLKNSSDYAKIENGILDITNPTKAQGNQTITLVATCTINDVIITKEFNITILSVLTLSDTLDFGTVSKTGYVNNKTIENVEDSVSKKKYNLIAHYAQITNNSNELFKNSGMFAVLCPVRKNNNTKQSYIELSFDEAINKATFDATWWPNDSKNSSKITKFEFQYSTDKTTWTSIDLGNVADLDASKFTTISVYCSNAKYIRIFLEGDATYTSDQGARIIVDNLKTYK